MGRRPKWSESEPSTGDAKNWIAAHTVPNTAIVVAARAVSPPRKASTSFGSTGMIIPSASMSSSTVIRMNTTAARRTGVAVGSVMGSELDGLYSEAIPP